MQRPRIDKNITLSGMPLFRVHTWGGWLTIEAMTVLRDLIDNELREHAALMADADSASQEELEAAGEIYDRMIKEATCNES